MGNFFFQELLAISFLVYAFLPSVITSDATPLSMEPLSGGEDMAVEEGDSFPTVEKILPKNLLSRNDIQKEPASSPIHVVSETLQAHKNDLRSMYNISLRVEMVPTGRDLVEGHRPEYCDFYMCPFMIGHTLPLLPLPRNFVGSTWSTRCSYLHIRIKLF